MSTKRDQRSDEPPRTLDATSPARDLGATAAPAARLARARRSLDGLSVGDAFGELLMGAQRLLGELRLPDRRPWPWTDDTAMAISIVETLAAAGDIEGDALALRFATRYEHEPGRGYGSGAHRILSSIAGGVPWEAASRSVFGGAGSMGNGAAMRVAPIGAYFADPPAGTTGGAELNIDDRARAADERARAADERAHAADDRAHAADDRARAADDRRLATDDRIRAGDDFVRVIAAATRSAQPTHAHPDGIAGAIAIAVAAAEAARGGRELRRAALEHTPPGDTRDAITRVLGFPLDADPFTVASAVGNGSRVVSSDTVPFCLWAAERHLDSYETALWTTASVLGDMDTTCAIVGGIVALVSPIPAAWLAAREPLPSS